MKNFTFLSLFILLPILLNAQEINQAKLDSLFNILEENNQTMASIYISKNGETIYSNSTGFLSLEDNIKAVKKTVYRIGSITKIFTATLIFQMVDEGKISLDTPLSDYFPEIANASQISIGNLLNHSSGIYNITNSKGFDPEAKKTKQQMIEKISSFTPVFEPDTQSEYSNSNYILLGYIAEQIDGKSYSNILEERIAIKIGLENTYFGGPINILENEAYSYTYKNDWEKSIETNLELPHGAGALVSTPEDLTIFINSLFANQLLSEGSLAKMLSQKHGLGFGIHENNMDGLKIYGHDGSIDGFKALLLFIPQMSLSIALTSNANRYPLLSIIQSVIMASNSMDFELPSF